MKKRLFSLGLAGMLVLSLSTAAFAATIQSNGGRDSHDVSVTYVPVEEAPTVYAVDIAWGSMEFTYHAPAVEKVWNPQTHSYTESTAEKGTWSCEENANKVSLTNYSNKALTATIKAEISTETDYMKIEASVEEEELQLADASLGATTTEKGTASEASTIITLAGALEDKDAESTPIGSVTVTITDAEEVVTQ